MSAESRTRVSTLWQGSLLAVASLVLALVLAFPGAVFSGSTAHSHVEYASAEMDEAGSLAEAPCHHESVSDVEASESGHHGGSHDTGGCCALAVCGGACASVCSSVGVGGVLPGMLLPGLNGGGGLALRKVEDALLPGMQEAPFRPPIAELASSAS